MSDDNKLTLGARPPLGLKRTESAGNVKQSFSHGRTKSVVVEVKRRRIIGRPGEAHVEPPVEEPVVEVVAAPAPAPVPVAEPIPAPVEPPVAVVEAPVVEAAPVVEPEPVVEAVPVVEAA